MTKYFTAVLAYEDFKKLREHPLYEQIFTLFKVTDTMDVWVSGTSHANEMRRAEEFEDALNALGAEDTVDEINEKYYDQP